VALATYRVPKEHIEFCEAKYIDKVENMAENKHELREETIEFALEVSDVCEKIKGYSVYTNQLLRSSSSIGANVYEAKYAQSKADFVNKLEIALKESSETEYWIELLYRKQKFENEEYNRIKNKCGVIRRKLIASITTAKKKM
jgi:four helix bundle protein